MTTKSLDFMINVEDEIVESFSYQTLQQILWMIRFKDQVHICDKLPTNVLFITAF